MATPAPPAPPCTLANLESRRFGDTWPIECAGVTLTLDQQVANFNNADLTGRSGALPLSSGGCRQAAAPSHPCGGDGRSAARLYT